jgi:dihydroorotate dehydrogenase electron transfer subunit
VGARSLADLVLTDELARLGCRVHTATEDGSSGFQGLVTDLAAQLMGNETPDTVFACGPEGMLDRVMELADEAGIACQVSLERRIKCGFGVCGSCDLEGRLVCADGPVFTAEELRRRPWGGDCSCPA